jgi:hypothetical protein
MVEGEREMRERLVASQLPTEWLQGRVGVSEAIWPSSSVSSVSISAMYQMVCGAVEAQRAIQQSVSVIEGMIACGQGASMYSCGQGEMIACGQGAYPYACGHACGQRNACGHACGQNNACGLPNYDACGLCESEKSAMRETTAREQKVNALARCAQRKMMGFILGKIRAAQTFVELHNRQEHVIARRNRLVARTNEILIPWTRALCRIAAGKTFEKLDTWWNNEGLPSTCYLKKGINIVYARMNLTNKDLYVGETENWEERSKQHAYQYFRHSSNCENRCTNCDEHAKYIRAQKVPLVGWFMVPLAKCGDRMEAKKLELMLRRKWRPTLNAEDKPFWLLKDTYAKATGEKRKRAALPPWKRERQYEGGAIVTQYLINGTTRYDLRQTMREHLGQEISVQCNIGQKDITNWKKLRREFSSSYVSIHMKSGERTITTMGQWAPRTERKQIASFYIRPEEGPTKEWAVKLVKPVMRCIRRLEKATEDELESYWLTRNVLDKASRIKMRQIINAECTRRYNCPMKPISISMPFLKKIQGHKVKELITTLINEQPWPQFLKKWHLAKVKLTTTAQTNIADILTTVTMPSKICNRCTCKKVKAAMPYLPMINGHVLATGRDFQGEQKKTMAVCAANVPTHTWYDYFRAWESVRKQLPGGWVTDENAWKKVLFTVMNKGQPETSEVIPSTKEVFGTKKLLTGMVVGPLDKNGGELCVACPRLYHEALKNMYTEATGYERIYVAKLSQYRRKRYTLEEMPKQIIRGETLPKNQRGDEKDIVKMWHLIYKKQGWDKYAKFNPQGGFNQPYGLFKSKNMTDQKTREEKHGKIRPIAPGTKHPMRKLLHYVGRAWSFATAKMEGNHFAINKTADVIPFLKAIQKKLEGKGDLEATILDIKGCFPNMPRETIRFALRKIAQEFKQTLGLKGVWVPTRTETQACTWTKRKYGTQFLPFELMLDVMDFALDNAIVKMPDGQLMRQVGGIPMGDPLSPGMTIGACAWMEKEWMQTLTEEDKEMVHGRHSPYQSKE